MAGLSAGSLDAAFFVMSPRAPLVQRLVREPDLELLPERRHLAFAGRYPYLTAVQLGEGMLDLNANIPPVDIRLLAVAANLVVRNDLHPDHMRVLLRAAEQVHRRKAVSRRRTGCRRRCSPSCRSTRTPGATTATARPGSSGGCRSGSPGSWTACSSSSCP